MLRTCKCFLFPVAEGKPVHYDAFLSACDKDSSMKEQLMCKLEEKEGLKLFIPERDLLPGVSRHYVTAELIFRRCVLALWQIYRKLASLSQNVPLHNDRNTCTSELL